MSEAEHCCPSHYSGVTKLDLLRELRERNDVSSSLRALTRVSKLDATLMASHVLPSHLGTCARTLGVVLALNVTVPAVASS